MEWYCFIVVDGFAGLDCGFRWREVFCDCCGVGCQF